MNWQYRIEKLVKYHFDSDDMNRTRDKVICSLANSLKEDAEEIAENWIDEVFEQCWKECVEDNRQANDREDV